MNYFKAYYKLVIIIALCMLFVSPIHSQEPEISTYFNALSQAKQKRMHRFQIGEYVSKRVNNSTQLFDQVLNNKEYAPYWEDTLWQYYFYHQDDPVKVVDFMWDFAKNKYPKPSKDIMSAQENALGIINCIMCNPDHFKDDHFSTSILDIVEKIIQADYFETDYWQNRFDLEEMSMLNEEQAKQMTKEEIKEHLDQYLHSKLPTRTAEACILIISKAYYHTEDNRYKELILQRKKTAKPPQDQFIDYLISKDTQEKWKNKELYYLLPWNMEEGRRLKYQEYLNNEN